MTAGVPDFSLISTPFKWPFEGVSSLYLAFRDLPQGGFRWIIMVDKPCPVMIEEREIGSPARVLHDLQIIALGGLVIKGKTVSRV